MELGRLFIVLSIICVILLGFWLILKIIEPEEKVVVINELDLTTNLDSNLKSNAILLKSKCLTLEEKALKSNEIYYLIEQKKEEDLRILEKETKNWHGSVDGIEFIGRDERIFGSEKFHLYGEVDN